MRALLGTVDRGLDNVNRTFLVLASGKLVLQKKNLYDNYSGNFPIRRLDKAS